MDLELYERLVDAYLFRHSSDTVLDTKTKKALLSRKQASQIKSGQIFGKYLVLIKAILKLHNQELNINEFELNTLGDKQTPMSPGKKSASSIFVPVEEKNWKFLEAQLARIGLFVDADKIEECINGNIKEVLMLFRRIERFVKMITFEPQILDFSTHRKKLPTLKAVT